MGRMGRHIINRKHEIQYFDDALMEYFPNLKKGDVCYKVLCGKDEPCFGCPREGNQEYSWSTYNQKLKKWVDILYCPMTWLENSDLILICSGVENSQSEAKRKLKNAPSIATVLMECIDNLMRQDSVNNFQEFLKCMGEYYSANRAYIFVFDLKKQVGTNTFEWCAPGVTAEIDNLQNIPLEVVSDWIMAFQTVGEFYINSLDADVDQNSPVYRLLKQQNIESLITAPLIENGEIVGFIGLDDPLSNENDLATLRLTAKLISDYNMMAQLKSTSYIDSLTGVYNRNKYISVLDTLKQHKPQTIGIMYVDVNGLKHVNDELGHEFGDKLLIKCVTKASEIISKENIYRVGGGEFVVLLPNSSEDDFTDTLNQVKKTYGELVAIGSVWRSENFCISELVERADKEMYAEKEKYYQRMRNRT